MWVVSSQTSVRKSGHTERGLGQWRIVQLRTGLESMHNGGRSDVDNPEDVCLAEPEGKTARLRQIERQLPTLARRQPTHDRGPGPALLERETLRKQHKQDAREVCVVEEAEECDDGEQADDEPFPPLLVLLNRGERGPRRRSFPTCGCTQDRVADERQEPRVRERQEDEDERVQQPERARRAQRWEQRERVRDERRYEIPASTKSADGHLGPGHAAHRPGGVVSRGSHERQSPSQ